MSNRYAEVLRVLALFNRTQRDRRLHHIFGITTRQVDTKHHGETKRGRAGVQEGGAKEETTGCGGQDLWLEKQEQIEKGATTSSLHYQ